MINDLKKKVSYVSVIPKEINAKNDSSFSILCTQIVGVKSQEILINLVREKLKKLSNFFLLRLKKF